MIDHHLTKREFMFAYPAIIIGISVLALPSTIAQVTAYSDGWLSILAGGLISSFFAILAMKVASHFPGQSFLEYASILVTKPIAIFLAFLYILSFILLNGAITRTLAYVAQQYLFDRTPIEALGLAFLLVVIYAVSGLRIGLFRLNMLFLPLILGIFLIVGLFNIRWIEAANYFPLFKTAPTGYMDGTFEAFNAFVGFSIGLFYVNLIKKPSNLTRKVLAGMSIPILFYLFVFFIAIGVFGNTVTGNLMLPTLELARKVDVSGAIFERVDAFVYTIWTMAIFNSVSMIYDIVILLLMSLFKKLSKINAVLIVAPVIYFIAMFPKSMDVVKEITRWANLFAAILSVTVISIFYIMIKWKGKPSHDSN